MTKNIIEKELLELREYSEKNEEKQKKFWSDKKLLNKKTGELEDVSFNLKKEYKKSYDDIVSKSIYFRKEMEEKYQDNFTSLFITLTTNTQYHKYKKSAEKDNLIPNPRYNKKNTIHGSYVLLNEVKRKITNEFNKNDFGREKIFYRYIQVVEKHFSLEPHIHIVLFVPNEHLEATIRIIKNKMKCTDEKRVIVDDKNKPINKYEINTNYFKNKYNNIGRCELEILQDSKKITSYVSKYIEKSFKSDDIDCIHELDGWKRKNKIRLVHSSRTPVPKYIYKKIFSNITDEEKKEYEDLFCDIQNNSTLIKTDIKTGETKTKKALKEEIFKAHIRTSTIKIIKQEVTNEIELIKKLCMRELKQNHTEQEVNINLKIFDLFISNTDISKLNKNLILDNFFVKKDSFYEESVYLDEILTNRYDKWLNKLLNHIEKDNNTIINLTKIERLIIQHREEVIYDSDDWELIEYINEKIA
ncbi:replication endonuclease [Aliarcobacter cryaerophilus]|uniref:replication endonuclease n=1 Tax=Aliarcobacter cryaerophilus TaxID=28198 RepID=UPI0011DFAF7A|nr:replication endonuclease [Aliarcobacter cryaerophilus]